MMRSTDTYECSVQNGASARARSAIVRVRWLTSFSRRLTNAASEDPCLLTERRQLRRSGITALARLARCQPVMVRLALVP
ncbi:hypothetical protein [Sorangium sp. So ce887]|uniref:hypothetical protein n=1 Tax=Sorangium sp. So ce887 TaxID=3133324 RepID=UPI003F5F7C63